jgi:hypothetical protein
MVALRDRYRCIQPIGEARGGTRRGGVTCRDSDRRWIVTCCDDRGMFVSYDPDWDDQNSSWWAKINRAREHVESAHRLVEQFRASQPYSLLPEPTDKPGRVAYRLRITRPVPVAMSTTVGDALHNMRAALESLAFELAGRSYAARLTAA